MLTSPNYAFMRRRLYSKRKVKEYIRFFNTGIIPFSDCGEFAVSLVSGVVSFMVEGRVGFVKGLKNIFFLSISNSNLL